MSIHNSFIWSLEYAPGKRLEVVEWLSGAGSLRPVLRELNFEEVDALTLEEYNSYKTALYYYYKNFWPMTEVNIPEQMDSITRIEERKRIKKQLDIAIPPLDKDALMTENIPLLDKIAKFNKNKNDRLELEKKLDPKNPKWSVSDKSQQIAKMSRFY